MKHFSLLFFGSLISMPLINTAVQAQTTTESAWHYQVTPYLWFSNLDGRIRPISKLPQAHIKRTQHDMLNNLKAAAFLQATARKDDLVLLFDLSYASLGAHQRLPLNSKINVKVKQQSISLMAGKRLLHNQNHTLALLAGARYWDIKAQLALEPTRLEAVSSSQFIDPLLALRYTYNFTPKLSVLSYADIGGFHVGSKKTWQALASLNYQVTNSMYISAGYRHMDVDYRKSGQRLDFTMSGPVVGLSYQF